MADRIVWGYVDGNNGNRLAGVGYRVDHVDPGLYTVFFDPPFAEMPTVVASQVFTGDVDYHGGDTRDNAVVVGIDKDRFRVETGNSSGVKSDRRFSFVAIGI